MDLNIHRVTSIDVEETKVYVAETIGHPYASRHITITDDAGAIFTINLYSIYSDERDVCKSALLLKL